MASGKGRRRESTGETPSLQQMRIEVKGIGEREREREAVKIGGG